MSEVQQIKDQVRKLSRSELADFRAWYAKFDADEWDRQIEQDTAAGKLDALADEALQAHASRSTTDLWGISPRRLSGRLTNRSCNQSVQRLAGKNYALLKNNPDHPSLHFKYIGRYRSVRAGLWSCPDFTDTLTLWIKESNHGKNETAVPSGVSPANC